MQGLSGFDLPPSGKVLLKSNFSKTPDVSARRSRAFFTSLNLPFSTGKLLGDGQAVAEPSKPCPL